MINLVLWLALTPPSGLNTSQSPGKGKKGGKKRNPWSDSEDEDGNMSDSDLDDDDKAAIMAAAKDRGPRRAAGEIALALSFILQQFKGIDNP